MKSNRAAAAAMIRKHLKSQGIAASVRARSYSGGSSIDVTIKQDVTPAARDEIKSYCEQFKYGNFDGMTDCYEYSNRRDDIPQVSYVFVAVDYSAEIRAEARAAAEAENGAEYDVHTRAHQILCGNQDCGFWAARKPRLQVAAA